MHKRRELHHRVGAAFPAGHRERHQLRLETERAQVRGEAVQCVAILRAAGQAAAEIVAQTREHRVRLAGGVLKRHDGGRGGSRRRRAEDGHARQGEERGGKGDGTEVEG